MRKAENSSMTVRYARCNNSPNLFCLVDWQANKVDVLHVPALLDQLPSRLILKTSKNSCKALIHGDGREERYFLMLVPNEDLFVYKYLEVSPFFLPSTGLQGLKVSFKGNWRGLSFKFEFPRELMQIEAGKGGWLW